MRKTLLLFTVLLFGLQGWATTFTVDGATYTITDATNKTVAIGTGTSTAAISKSTAGAFTIPSSVSYNGENYAVTAVGDKAFYYCTGLTSISIANSVTAIGSSSFEGCRSFTSIFLPDAITSIGTFAFYGCSNLSSIALPGNLTSLSGYLFGACSKLTNISIPNSVTSIGYRCFSDCSGLTSATIPASVVSIGIVPFEFCTRLTSITVDSNNPNYCSVDGVLFNKNKTSLIQYPLGNTQTGYSIPNTVTDIEFLAFENCLELTSISIPSSVKSISSYAFLNCSRLTSIYANNIDPGKITLGSSIFYSVPTSTCTLYVPTGSKTLYAAIDQWKAFSIVEQENIYSIFANSSLAAGGKVEGSGAYSSGTSCTLIATPSAGYVFTGWTENGAIVSTDVNYTFPVSATRTLVANFNALITASPNPTNYGSVAGSGNYVAGSSCTLTATPASGCIFSNWTENGNVVSSSATYTFTVSSTRTLVANFATPCILSLSANSIDGGVVTGSGTYGKGSIQTVTATPNDGYGFKGWINKKGTVLSTSKSYSFTLTKDTVLTANFAKTYDFVDNNGLYYKISSSTTAYVTYRNSAGGDYSGAIVVPGSATINGTSYNVTAIGDSAFYNCSGLTSISIANSVTSIGRYSFCYCNKLTSLTLPNAITSIGMSAFSACSSLASVTLPSSLTSLSAYLFSDCSKLTAITIPNSVTAIGNGSFSSCSELTAITIPNSVTAIGAGSFSYCSGLTAPTIPASVVSIGIDAFEYCTGLTSITVDSNNPSYCSVDGVLFDKNKTSLIQYPLGNTQTSYSVPNTVTTIGQDAFERGVKLTTVSIPPSVTAINSYAFYKCSGLTSIYANNSDPGKITLGGSVFYSVPTATCTLYVPTGSKALYAAANQWKAFTIIEDDNLFAIYAKANPNTGGTVTGSGSYTFGKTCILTARPAPGYSFVNWTEDGVEVPETWLNYVFTSAKDTTYALSIYQPHTLVANFAINSYNVTASPSIAGGGAVTGSGTYTYGSSCTLQATATTGYSFTGWVENGTIVSTSTSYRFTVNSARNIVANFSATIAVLVNPTYSGSVTGTGRYNSGATCTLTATANSSYVFINWTENGAEVSKDASYTFTVDRARTLVANFTNKNNSINATSASTTKGTITGGGTYIYGSTCTLKATPKTGYVFTGWTENDAIVSANSSYTFIVSAARTLVANFSAVGVTVTQPTATKLSGSIIATPSTGFTYSIDGKTYQSSNEFPYVSIGTYNVTLKNVSDGTVSSPVLAVVNASGVVAANNYQIKASNCTCRDTKDGAIAVTLAKALDYTVTVTATSTGSEQSVMFSGTSYNLKNLPADTYKLVFNIDFLDNYEQSFNVVVTQPDDLSVLKVSAEKSRATYTLSGGANYYVSVNDNTTETQGDQVQVSLVAGENKIKIYTEKLCQGVYEETIYNSESGQISIFPNPTTGKITLGIPGEEESVTAEIVSLSGAVQLEQKLVVPASRLVDIDVSDFIRGTYIVKLNGSTVHSSVKMIKK